MACGFAVFTKLVGAFYVLPLIGVLTIWAGGWRSLLRRRTVVLVALAVTPGLLYAAYGTFVNPFLGQASQGRFQASMLTTGFFWSQWWDYATLMVGVGPLLLAGVGLVLSRGRARCVMLGLLLGYVAYGVTFTFLYADSIYYHLPLVLPVAIGIAVVVGAVERSLRGNREPSLAQVGVASGVAIVIVASLFFSGLPLVPPGVSASAYKRVVTEGTAIGRIVHHDTKVILMAPGDGDPLRYHALVAGTTWPQQGDRFLLGTEGVKLPSDARELQILASKLGAGYFVADGPTLDGDTTLRAYLDHNFAVVAGTPGYRIYDLRQPLRS